MQARAESTTRIAQRIRLEIYHESVSRNPEIIAFLLKKQSDRIRHIIDDFCYK
jgi:hypothetical protein